MMHIRTLFNKGQFCPTVEDIENKELKNLAKRLKGDSEKETLTNILEWQDRNIHFWWERWPFADIILIFSILTIFLLFPLLPYSKFLDVFTLLIVFIAVCLEDIALTVVYLHIRYRTFLGEKTLKEKVKDTFCSSLPVYKILEYKLAVCRDYAKLTASLLFNIYPDSELYFIKIPFHVVAGIKIKNKIYLLDQRLPILSLDKWLIKWNRKEANISRFIINSRGKPNVIFSEHKRIPKKFKPDLPKINTEKLEKLTEEIAKTLGIKQNSHKDKPDFKITLPNYAIAIYYDDDEIIKYSLIRAIKNRLESELCGNMSKISKVNISQNEQNKRDLTVAVCLLPK